MLLAITWCLNCFIALWEWREQCEWYPYAREFKADIEE